MYLVKINLKNGEKYVVKHDYKSAEDLLNKLLGHGDVGTTVNIMQLLNETIAENKKFNTIAILSTEISTVELWIEQNNGFIVN